MKEEKGKRQNGEERKHKGIIKSLKKRKMHLIRKKNNWSKTKKRLTLKC